MLRCVCWSPIVTLKFYWGKFLLILILARFLFAPSLRIPVCFTRSIDFQTIPPLLRAAAMSEVVTTALILGHSFVKRLKRDLHQGFDSRASCDFNLLGTASVRLHGVGRRTVQTLQANDLHVVREVLTIFLNFHQRRSALLSKIWCVCFRAIFQFARSASVMSSHVASSSHMPCRFGVTQRFWTNMLVSFWLIYTMFFVGVILSSIKISV